MKTLKRRLALGAIVFLTGCGGGGGDGDAPTPPDPPSGVTVSAGPIPGTTALVHFTAPAWDGGSTITGYTVTVEPGGQRVSSATSPMAVSGLVVGTAYTFNVVANNAIGSSEAGVAHNVNRYRVVETFHEPMTQPNDTIFTGSFAYDSIGEMVSDLEGSLTQSMTKPDPACVPGGMGSGKSCFGGPMTTVELKHQLSAERVTIEETEGLLVTTFALPTTDTFDGGGFAPGGTEYFGLSEGAPNPNAGGTGNAYAMIFVNLADPTAALSQAQLDRLAYADCTAGGMMKNTCMTGTTVAGYGRTGTMGGYPISQVITPE